MSRRLIVTGAASGIGQAVVRRALDAGWSVAGIDLLFDDDSELPSTMRHRADIANQSSVAATVEVITQTWGGPPDALVHSAGIYRVAPSIAVDTEEWDVVLSVNTRGSFLVARAVAAAMTRARRPGAVVLIGSVAAHRGDAGEPTAAYAASKGAVAGLMRQLAVEWGPAGIRVNLVVPGVIDTPMTTVTGDLDAAEALLQRLPLGRLGRADEVAAACMFLAGTDASYITGTELAVDGGYLIS